MRYIFAANTYWPVWLFMSSIGRPWLGILLGVIVAIAALALTWYLTWGDFKGLFGPPDED